MTFADLATGDAIFLDANTFIYHFGPEPVLGPPCSQLLQRIQDNELIGFTSMPVLAEALHKLMTIEANGLFGWPLTGMANRLRRHPAEVQKLTAYKIALDQVSQSPVRVLDVSLLTLQHATSVCRQTGLLINDALIAAVMQQYGLTRLASHDSDFDQIAGVTRYSPV